MCMSFDMHIFLRNKSGHFKVEILLGIFISAAQEGARWVVESGRVRSTWTPCHPPTGKVKQFFHQVKRGERASSIYV